MVWFIHKYFVSAGWYTNFNFCGHFSASFDTLWRYHIIIQFVNIHPSHLYFESTGAKKLLQDKHLLFTSYFKQYKTSSHKICETKTISNSNNCTFAKLPSPNCMLGNSLLTAGGFFATLKHSENRWKMKKRELCLLFGSFGILKKKTGFVFCIFPDFHCGWSYT